ncbi:MAG: hypothetical protein R3279_01150 [Putridiphycobacter sp.]|nr:hypothetical protein [Putridiphycobacter sp.]
MTFKFIIYGFYLLVVLSYGLYNFNKITRPFKYVVALIFTALVLELYGKLSVVMGAASDHYIFHFCAVSFIFLNFLIYRQLLKQANKIIRQIVLIVSICALAGTLANSFFYQVYPVFPSIGISLHAGQTIILSLLVFQEMIKKPLKESLIYQPLFWLNTGNLFFYTFTFLVFAFFNFFKETVAIYSWLLPFVWIAALAMYTCYFAALYLDKNRMHAN